MDRRGIARRVSIPIATSILILFIFVCIPLVSANAHEVITANAQPVTPSTTPSVQGTPIVDATLTALQKEQLTEQVNQQQHNFQNWFWNVLTTSFSSIVLLVGGLFAFFRWLADRQDARKKQAEERFKSVVEGLGSESTDAKIASAVLLRTFLSPGYKEFYTQVFDLAVANLRSRKHIVSSITVISSSSVNVLESPDSFSQALITIFREAFPHAREELKKQKSRFVSQFLDATDIQLDNAFLYGADLRLAWMPRASLSNANLKAAMLDEINLREANLRYASLDEAILSNATLTRADFTQARLTAAVLTGAILKGAILTSATLNGADLSQVDLSQTVGDGEPRHSSLSYAQLVGANLIDARLDGADLTGANLTDAQLVGSILIGARLDGANLTGADLTKVDLSEAHPEVAKSLEGTRMVDVIGLTIEEKMQCKAKGAIIE